MDQIRPGLRAVSRLAEANPRVPARKSEIGNRRFGPVRMAGGPTRLLWVDDVILESLRIPIRWGGRASFIKLTGATGVFY